MISKISIPARFLQLLAAFVFY